MKRLLLIASLVTTLANAGSMINGTWYGIGVPTAIDIASNIITQPSNMAYPQIPTQYIYTNPIQSQAPVVMQEEIVHSANMHGPYKGDPRNIFMTECMRYGYNQNQCIAIWGN
jgi:hypothetical protein